MHWPANWRKKRQNPSETNHLRNGLTHHYVIRMLVEARRSLFAPKLSQQAQRQNGLRNKAAFDARLYQPNRQRQDQRRWHHHQPSSEEATEAHIFAFVADRA